MEEIDYRNKRKEGKYMKFFTNNISYFVGLYVLAHVIWNAVIDYGSVKS